MYKFLALLSKKNYICGVKHWFRRFVKMSNLTNINKSGNGGNISTCGNSSNSGNKNYSGNLSDPNKDGRELVANDRSFAGIETVIQMFLADQQVMDISRRSYGWALRRFFKWCEKSGRVLGSLQRSDIVTYVESLAGDGYSPKTIAAYVVAVRRFYGWLDSIGKYPNIAQGVKRPRKMKDTFVKMHLDMSERLALMDYARKRCLRDFAIINLMLRNGLRTMEVTRLDVGDVTEKRGVRVMKVWRKGSLAKDEIVALTDEAYQPIREYLLMRGRTKAGDPLFVTDGKGHRAGRMTPRRVQQIVKDGLRAIGLTSRDFSPHSLRHTTAVAILENGGTVRDVQVVLGHSSVSTSEIYIKSAEEDMRLANPPEKIIKNAFG